MKLKKYVSECFTLKMTDISTLRGSGENSIAQMVAQMAADC